MFITINKVIMPNSAVFLSNFEFGIVVYKTINIHLMIDKSRYGHSTFYVYKSFRNENEKSTSKYSVIICV